MILLDANVLIYAFNNGFPQHEAMQRWLTGTLASGETIAVPWISAWAFLRISTNPRLVNSTETVDEVLDVLERFLSFPQVVTLNPDKLHLPHLRLCLHDTNIRGSETTDAVLAAIAIEHGATLASADLGFRRFRKLKLLNPLEHPIR